MWYNSILGYQGEIYTVKTKHTQTHTVTAKTVYISFYITIDIIYLHLPTMYDQPKVLLLDQ